MLIAANPKEAEAILGAMRSVADADGPGTLTDADRHTLIAATPVTDLQEQMTVPPLEAKEAANSDGTEGPNYHPIA